MAITKIQSESLNLADDFAFTGTITGAGGNMKPAFHADLSSNQNISQSVVTKVQFNSEVLDTDNCYDNSTNYRFTPTTAGKYFVYLVTRLSWNSGGNGTINCYIYKNGSQQFRGVLNCSTTLYGTVTVSGIINMNGSSDYLEGFAEYNASLPMVTGGGTSHFGAYKIIE